MDFSDLTCLSSPDTRCISPWHLLWSLLFSSHTSLLVRNWWAHRGMSLDERHHVTETDLFPAFLLRPCQLTQYSLLHTGTQTLTSCRALLPLRIGPAPPRCSNFICKTFPRVISQIGPSDWISPEMRVDDAMIGWACRQHKAFFLLTSWPWVIAVRTTRHFCLNPQITRRFIWTASFRCLTEYREPSEG